MTSTLMQDLRYGMRILLKNPGFTTIAVLTLALGIGANTALFSVVDAVLLRSLPYPHIEELIALKGGQSWPDLSDIRQQAHSIDKLGAFAVWQFDLVGKGEPRLIDGALVSLDLFPALDAHAQTGRVFSTPDDLIGGARVAVVSHRFWQDTLGARADAIGSAVTLSGNPYTIIGVMPVDFRLPTGAADVFVPFRVGYPEAAPYRGVHMQTAIARLRPGSSMAQMQAELNVIGEGLAKAHPDENRDRRYTAVSLQSRFLGNVRPAILMLFTATGVVLLIASANFANLLLSKTARRRQEIAIRMALGAAKIRVVRQLVTESVLLALLGGGAGLLLAYWAQHTLAMLKPKDLANVPPFSIDARVLAFAIGVSLLTGCIFGLLPAIELNASSHGGSLRERMSTAHGKLAARLRQSLIVGELALSLVLLCGAGLLIRSLWQVQGIDPGFNPSGVLSGHIWLQQKQYDGTEAQNRFFSQLEENLNSIPGIESAALVSELPLSGNNISHNFLVNGHPRPLEGAEPEAATNVISPGYFHTMEIPMIAGRAFSNADREGSTPVAIINQSMVRQFFPGEDPMGKQIRYARERTPRWMTIVGVAADTKDLGLDEDEGPAIYTPVLQKQEQWRRYSFLVLRTRNGDPMSLAAGMKQAVWKLNSQVPVTPISPLSRMLDQSLSPRRINTMLLAIFAGTALLLAIIGLYGVISYAIAQRTREIGVRMALGARREDVVLMVFREGLQLSVAGVILGCTASLLSARLMSSLLFNVKPLDILTFVAASATLVITALLASLIPARRAAGVDPVKALRYE
jgi:putative ABC transport system permease protein